VHSLHDIGFNKKKSLFNFREAKIQMSHSKLRECKVFANGPTASVMRIMDSYFRSGTTRDVSLKISLSAKKKAFARYYRSRFRCFSVYIKIVIAHSQWNLARDSFFMHG
jgi:hypothetical protein